MKSFIPITPLLTILVTSWTFCADVSKNFGVTIDDAITSIRTEQTHSSISHLDTILDSLTQAAAIVKQNEFIRPIYSFYLPVRGLGDHGDSINSVVRVKQSLLSLQDSIQSIAVIRTVSYSLTIPDAEWNNQLLYIDIVSNGKLIFTQRFPVKTPSSRSGFNSERSYHFSVKRYLNRSIVEQVIIDAPAMPSEAEYKYYLYTAGVGLRSFSQPYESIFGKVTFHRDSAFTLFTSGCMTCRIPLSLDLPNCSIEINAPKTTIFPVMEYSPDEVPKDYNSIQMMSFFEQPNINARHRNVLILPLQHIKVLKLSVPRGPTLNNDDVWAYVEISGQKGWIKKEAQDRLGLTACD